HFALTQNGDLARIYDDERFEVQDAFEIAHGNVQQVADAAGQALEQAHVRTRGCQLDVGEALAANPAQGQFHTAPFRRSPRDASCAYICPTNIPSRLRGQKFWRKTGRPVRV